jgi:hypothetical protein
MAANGDDLTEKTLERIEAKLDRLVDLPARVDVVENRLMKIGAVVEALGSKLDHIRSELLLRMDQLRLELLEAAQDEAKFASSGQAVLAEQRFDKLQAQLDELTRRLEALEKTG